MQLDPDPWTFIKVVLAAYAIREAWFGLAEFDRAREECVDLGGFLGKVSGCPLCFGLWAALCLVAGLLVEGATSSWPTVAAASGLVAALAAVAWTRIISGYITRRRVAVAVLPWVFLLTADYGVPSLVILVLATAGAVWLIPSRWPPKTPADPEPAIAGRISDGRILHDANDLA